MPARPAVDDGFASRDTAAATADTDEASSSSPSSLPSQSRYGPSNPALTVDYAQYASSDAAYAQQNAFFGGGSDPYGNQNQTITGSSDGRGTEQLLTGHPQPANGLQDQAPFIPSYGTSEWHPAYGSFLDLAQAYDPQGELAHEQSETNQPPVFSIPQPVAPRTEAVPKISIPDSSKAPNSAASTTGPPLAPRTALKRKAETEPNSANSDRLRGSSANGQIGRKRTVSFGRMSKPSQSPSAEGAAENTGEDRFGSYIQGQSSRQPSDNGGARALSTPSSAGMQSAGKTPGILRAVPGNNNPSPSILPAEKVFPIQIGSELFRLSGASIASDGECSIAILERLSLKQCSSFLFLPVLRGSSSPE